MRRNLMIAVVLSACASGGRNDSAAPRGTLVASRDVRSDVTPQRPMTDRNALAALEAADRHEMDVARLALSRSRDLRVQALARTILDDHAKMLGDTDALAIRLGLVPEKNGRVAAQEREGREAVAELARLEGPAFDRKFITLAVEDHEKALRLLESLEATSAAEELRLAIAQSRPIIEAHLAHAKAMQQGRMN